MANSFTLEASFCGSTLGSHRYGVETERGRGGDKTKRGERELDIQGDKDANRSRHRCAK